MLSLNSRIAAIIIAVAPVLAQSPTAGGNAPLGTAFNGAQDIDFQSPPPMATPPSNREGEAATDVPSVTINLVNSMTVPVNVFYVSATSSTGSSPPFVGNPPGGVVQPAQSTSVVAPQEFSGQSTINIDGTDGRASKWELSLSADPNTGIHTPFIDVSYVDGYSVPITCSCNGDVVTGCNKDLFNSGIPCGNQVAGPVCINPNAGQPESFKGPAAPFFAPCSGAAYTFPADDGATMGCPGATTINCCVGPSCPAPARQPARRRLAAMRRGIRAGSL